MEKKLLLLNEVKAFPFFFIRMKLFNFVLESANYKGENFCSFIILITKSIYGTFLPLLIYMTCKSFSNMFHIIQQ